jgi:hypothetical protein
MNSNHPAWDRLVAAARNAPDDRSLHAPYGFATRVVALASAAQARPSRSLFEQWSWRAVVVAGTFAAVALTINHSAVRTSLVDDIISDETSVATLFD